jgi:hypothetical protein
MARLLFFSRVAFLCNICFLSTFLVRYVPALKEGFFVSTIIVIGLVMSVVSHYVPLWLVVINFLFFVFQVILLMK